jgi:hypothetical protein
MLLEAKADIEPFDALCIFDAFFFVQIARGSIRGT